MNLEPSGPIHGEPTGRLPNGPGAAAILAAGIGSLALGVFAFVGDAWRTIGQSFILWPPVGALSGVTTGAIVIWLLTWFGLGRRWRARDVNLTTVNVAAFLMLVAALLLTFPPFMDLLQGK
jgi:hypothetical protein